MRLLCPRYRWSAAVGAAVALLVGLLPLSDFGERWELRSQDARYRIRGYRPTNARIVLAPVTEATANSWSDEPIVAWGGHYADMVREADRAGARTIGLDLVQSFSTDE